MIAKRGDIDDLEKKPIKCRQCGKMFFTNKNRQFYCHKPCISPTQIRAEKSMAQRWIDKKPPCSNRNKNINISHLMVVYRNISKTGLP